VSWSCASAASWISAACDFNLALASLACRSAASASANARALMIATAACAASVERIDVSCGWNERW
jgi:hypothetical protein